jgi:RNA polymerase sigma-70 factor (ECF subfamily)
VGQATVSVAALGGVVHAHTDARVDFAEFFDQMWPDLVAFCRTLTGSAHAAEEMTQETLTRVCARYPVLREPRPYAFRIAANLVRKAWKDAQRTAEADLESIPDPDAGRRVDHTIDAVRRLPARLRDVVLLHYYADQPIEVVAAQLHRPVGTVKRRLHEARQQLAVALNEEIA